MDWKKILSLGLTIIFIFSALTLTVPSQIVKALPSRTATSSPANYPYSNWLSVWQSPNLTEPNSIAEPFWNDFPGANVTTPGMTADYWGTKWFFIYTPDLMRPAGWGSYWSYSWAQINDTNLFPADCKLTIQVSNATIAAEISLRAMQDPRIEGGWIDDFQIGHTTPAFLSTVYSALKSHKTTLKLYLIVYTDNTFGYDPYWQSPASAGAGTWAQLSPYFDAALIRPWVREYSRLYYHATAWYDVVKDFASMIPGKEIVGEIFNWHYTYATFPWDYMADILAQTARLYREGVISKISMIAAFYTQHAPTQSSYIRGYLASEFAREFDTDVDLIGGTVTTTVDGQPTVPAVEEVSALRPGNWTFWSRHTQLITFTGLGAYPTIRNLRTGDVVEMIIPQFVAQQGEKYQVYNWPHTYLHYAGNLVISTNTTIADKEILIEGSFYVNASLTIERSLIQFGLHRYDDTIDNQTLPAWGFIVKSNETTVHDIVIENSTIEPLHRLFPYQFQSGTNYGGPYLRHWHISNSTIACYASYFRPSGVKGWFADNIFFEAVYAGYGNAGIEVSASACYAEYWYRNLMYNVEGPALVTGHSSLGVWIDSGDRYMDGTFYYGLFRFVNNTIVGSQVGLSMGQDSNPSTTSLAESTVLCRVGYNLTADDHGPYAYPNRWHQYRDMAKGWTYTPFILHDTYGSGWTGRHDILTTKFVLQTAVPISGILRDAAHAAIGLYSSTAGSIQVYNIPLAQGNEGVLSYQHPFPWTFEITSALPEDHYYAVASLDSFSANRSLLLDPWFIPFENKTFSIYEDTVTSLVLEQLDNRLYTGVPQCLDDSLTIHMGNYLRAWSTAKYVPPTFAGLNLTSTNRVWINVTEVSVDNASVPVALTVTTSDSSDVLYSVHGLIPGDLYAVEVSGNISGQMRTVNETGVLSFTLAQQGSYSITLVVVFSANQLLNMLMPIIIIAILITVLGSMLGVFIGVGSSKSRK